jgi:hypothetical protein
MAASVLSPNLTFDMSKSFNDTSAANVPSDQTLLKLDSVCDTPHPTVIISIDSLWAKNVLRVFVVQHF